MTEAYQAQTHACCVVRGVLSRLALKDTGLLQSYFMATANNLEGAEI